MQFSINPDTLNRLGTWNLAMLGEAVVVADITARGYFACVTNIEQAPFDLLVHSGPDLLRVQVKTTATVIVGSAGDGRTKSRYDFKVGGKYPRGTVDLFAFVALDVGAIRYCAPIEVNAGASKKHFGFAEFAERSAGSFDAATGHLDLQPPLFRKA